MGTFVKEALKVIEEIRARGRLPIVVGGTHYYTQSLLFEDQLAENRDDHGEAQFVESPEEQWPVLREPTDVLLEELKKVDPIMAERWHPKDRRKIQRSLEIYLQSGRKASEVYEQQRARKASKGQQADDVVKQGTLMRFPTLMFWVHADPVTLRERLDTRVKKMMRTGLLGEVQYLNAFADREAASGHPVDESRGIWISIGYKEFKAYVKSLEDVGMGASALEKLQAEAVERTQTATRQYAKRQVRWIRAKLLSSLVEASCLASLFLLDGSKTTTFQADVSDPAIDLTHRFLTASAPLPAPASMSTLAAEMLIPKSSPDLSAIPERWTKHYCDMCGVTCVTEEQWSQHSRSRAHRRLVARAAKLEDPDQAPGRSVDND